MLIGALVTAICEWADAGAHYERVIANVSSSRAAVRRIEMPGFEFRIGELEALRKRSRDEWRAMAYMLGGHRVPKGCNVTAGYELVSAQSELAAIYERGAEPVEVERARAEVASRQAERLALIGEDHAFIDALELSFPDLLRRERAVDDIAAYDRLWREYEVQRLRLESLRAPLLMNDTALQSEYLLLKRLYDESRHAIHSAVRVDEYRRGNELVSRRSEIGFLRSVIASDRRRVEALHQQTVAALERLAAEHDDGDALMVSAGAP